MKVKKWADRAISDEERETIPDRDDAVFDCKIIDHLDDSAGDYLPFNFGSKNLSLKKIKISTIGRIF